MNFSPFWGAHWQAGGYCSITAAKWILHNNCNTMNTGWNNECSINSFEEDQFCFWSLLLSVVCQYTKYWTQKQDYIFFSFPLTFALPENPNIDQLAFVEGRQLTHSFPRREREKKKIQSLVNWCRWTNCARIKSQRLKKRDAKSCNLPCFSLC